MQRYFSHICDDTHVQADWRSCTYGRAPNAIDISQVSLTCPSYTDTGPPILYGDSDRHYIAEISMNVTLNHNQQPDTPPHLVAFYDTLGIRRMYYRLKPPSSSRGSFKEHEQIRRIVVPRPATNLTLEVGKRSRSPHGTNGKDLSQGSCMPNINALSLILQKIWPRLKFLWQTDGQTDRGTDGRMIFNVPTLSRKAWDKNWSTEGCSKFKVRKHDKLRWKWSQH